MKLVYIGSPSGQSLLIMEQCKKLGIEFVTTELSKDVFGVSADMVVLDDLISHNSYTSRTFTTKLRSSVKHIHNDEWYRKFDKRGKRK